MNRTGRMRLAAVAGALAVSGCAVSATNVDPGPSVTSASSGVLSVEAVRQLTRDISFDYDVVASNKELADLSDVVLSGDMVEVSAGPQFGKAGENDGLSKIQSVVLQVRADDVAKGPVKPGESLYLVVYAPDGVDAAAWNKAVPAGTAVAVYATRSPNDAPKEGSTGIDTIDWRAGRPAGAALYVPSVQGLAVQVEDGTLYWPLTDVTRAGAVAAALPGGDAVGNPLPGEDEPG